MCSGNYLAQGILADLRRIFKKRMFLSLVHRGHIKKEELAFEDVLYIRYLSAIKNLYQGFYKARKMLLKDLHQHIFEQN